jgi:hypothetical protein
MTEAYEATAPSERVKSIDRVGHSSVLKTAGAAKPQ